MPIVRTSYTHPLRIDVIDAHPRRGLIGITFCPGKSGPSSAFRGEWQRDLDADIAVVKAWGPRAVVTLLEDHEFDRFKVQGLPRKIEESGMEWYHLPIRDGHAPGGDFERAWVRIGVILRNHLDSGERILVHCRGGLGRSGTVAARLLIESGMEPRQAIREVRKTRRGAIETTTQETYVRSLTRGVDVIGKDSEFQTLDTRMSFGEIQRHGTIAMVPVFYDSPAGTDYQTLSSAIESAEFQVTELDEHGSVPTLSVKNNGDRRVLLVGGEELLGAKQNRVLNTSVMVLPSVTIDVPVSCTEQGRWSYSSENFRASPTIMPRNSRMKNKRSVDLSLEARGSFEGDQGAVWDDISVMQQRAGVSSKTNAMRDVIDANWSSIAEYTEAFRPVDGQNGAIFLANGTITGMELFSKEDAFRSIFPKIVGSYAFDHITNTGAQESGIKEASVEGFLQRLTRSDRSTYPSNGEGLDLRFEGDRISGAALVCQGEIIHLSAYALSSTS